MKDGGPAFPVNIKILETKNHVFYHGMSLRDWFAGQALTGVLSEGQIVGNVKRLAALSYELADAMLEARGDE